MKPNIICIGFPKCGTTALYDIIKQHKDLAVSPYTKEPLYYYFKLLNKNNIKWYENRYYNDINLRDNMQIIEINTRHFYNGVAERINKDFPQDTKLIFIMRNPIERSYSDFKFIFINHSSIPYYNPKIVLEDIYKGHSYAFENYVLKNYKDKIKILKNRNKYRPLSGGFYYKYIQEYLKYFPKENMKFIIFEDFIKNQEQTCKELFKFLEIGNDKHIRYNIKTNEGNYKVKNIFLIYIYVYLGKLLTYLTEIQYLPNTSILKKLKDILFNFSIENDRDKSPMTEKTRHILENYYRKDKENLEKLLNRDLSDIWFK